MSIGPVDGLISGLNTQELVAKLMAAERTRVTELQNKKTTLKSRSDALRDISTRLTTLKGITDRLALRATLTGRTVTATGAGGADPSATATAAADVPTGSFTVRVDRLATASTARGTGPAGAAVNTAVALGDSNLLLPVTSGTFTINGTQFTVNPGADTLAGVLAAINAQTGVTGVTAALVADADGRAGNRLQLTTIDPVTNPIRLGNAGDTSNFLGAMKVLGVAAGGDGSITGQGALGGVKTSALLNAASTGTAIAGPGAFKINNVEITYNAGVDTLNDVIGRINSSTAGVTASYDSLNDRLVLTNNASGNLGMTLTQTSGNFLTAFKLVGAGDPLTLGQTARYSLDGGATWRTGVSNTVTDAMPGITLTLRSVSASDTTLTVGLNIDGAVTAVKEFVDTYNSTLQFIKDKTTIKNAAGKAEILATDSTARGVVSALRTMVTSRALGLGGRYTSLQDVGITTGAVGSAVGTTNKLTIDETKLRAALAANPTGVFELFSATSQVALTTPGDVSRVTGTPRMNVSGVYSITSNGSGTLSGTFTPTGGSAQALTGSGTITAGGTNTTLIPGLTLTGAGAFTGATSTITVTARAGVTQSIGSYLRTLTEADGTLDNKQDTITSEQQEIDDRIRRLNDRLDMKEKNLYAQFRRLEVSLAKLQAQSSQLLAGLSSFNPGNDDQ